MEFYGTIGPACAQLETLQRMVEAGMTGIRMNLSHGSLSAHKDWLDIIHAVGIPQLLIDLQGPELRIGTLPQPLVLKPGQSLRLGQGGVPCPAALVHAARPGQNLLLDDGRLLVQVAEADGAALQCTVVRGGTLQSRKSLAAPGLTVASPTLTEEDLQNLQLAGACGVTGVMLPFVRGAEDIRTLRRALEQAGAGQIRIFAKIESLAGVQALPEFLPLVDEVVIARGDLGNAMPLWELPRCQKQLSAVCRSAGVPFMVVTQMLDSMCSRAVPTRAEVSESGALDDAARKTLRATIDLVHGARGSKGNEAESVLVLGDDVVNKTMPVILCDEDDVAGNHGATIGHVRDEQLFYLACRGLDQNAAEDLFVRAKLEDAALSATDERTRAAVVRLGNNLIDNFEEELA